MLEPLRIAPVSPVSTSFGTSDCLQVEAEAQFGAGALPRDPANHGYSEEPQEVAQAGPSTPACIVQTKRSWQLELDASTLAAMAQCIP
jgi:hypothetical protein